MSFYVFHHTPAAPHHSFLSLISHIRKGMELLNLDSIMFIQNLNFEITGYKIHKWATVHFSIPSAMFPCFPCAHLCMYVCASRGVWKRVCVCTCVHLNPCPSCSFVSRVDVLKWGHFLSVWCLRNNPTAQKLLQPSASTYLSLYLYCSGYAFLFDCPHAVC